MKKTGVFIIFVVVWTMCYSGCENVSYEERDSMASKISKDEATFIAWDAFKKAESIEVAQSYHVERIELSQGAWHILFLGKDAGVLGDHFLVIVNDDKTVKVLSGE